MSTALAEKRIGGVPADPKVPIALGMTEDRYKKSYRMYVKWRSVSPKERGAEKNEVDFMKKFDIEDRHIVAFVNEPSFTDDLTRETLIWAKSKTPDLFHMLMKEIEDSKRSADIERFMEMAHELNEKEKGNTMIQNNIFLTDEQYHKIIAREAKVIRPTDGQ